MSLHLYLVNTANLTSNSKFSWKYITFHFKIFVTLNFVNILLIRAVQNTKHLSTQITLKTCDSKHNDDANL